MSPRDLGTLSRVQTGRSVSAELRGERPGRLWNGVIHVQPTRQAVLLGTITAAVLALGMFCSAAFAAPSGPWAESPVAWVPTQSELRAYLVRPGDTLWSIARSQLGDPRRWPEIAELSTSMRQPGGLRLTDPDLVLPGWSLRLPVPAPGVAGGGLAGVKQVTAGYDFTCALLSTGEVECWGDNSARLGGQLRRTAWQRHD
jgi:hypothetical protein